MSVLGDPGGVTDLKEVEEGGGVGLQGHQVGAFEGLVVVGELYTLLLGCTHSYWILTVGLYIFVCRAEAQQLRAFTEEGQRAEAWEVSQRNSCVACWALGTRQCNSQQVIEMRSAFVAAQIIAWVKPEF